jgi:ABC-type iron transport system FetAB ATPase subunit
VYTMLNRGFPQGANFSGKSILLKQIALITYMAHIGALCLRGLASGRLLIDAPRQAASCPLKTRSSA